MCIKQSAQCGAPSQGSINITPRLLANPLYKAVLSPLASGEPVNRGTELSRCPARAAELSQELKWDLNSRRRGSPAARSAESLAGSRKLTLLARGPPAGAIAQRLCGRPVQESAPSSRTRPSSGGGSHSGAAGPAAPGCRAASEQVPAPSASSASWASPCSARARSGCGASCRRASRRGAPPAACAQPAAAKGEWGPGPRRGPRTGRCRGGSQGA